ncbi:MAG: hypothetical protein QM667_13580 [Asticcacaulis sp.]
MRQKRAEAKHLHSQRADTARPQPTEASAHSAGVPSPAHALQYQLLSALETVQPEPKLPLKWTLLGLGLFCAATWALVARVALG